MARRGRPPQPTALKLLKGTARADRMNPDEPTPPVKEPSMPRWLAQTRWGAGAVHVWRYMAPRLVALGLLTELDRYNLALYCDAVARVAHWRRAVTREGPVQTTETGYRAQNPEVAYMNQAIKDERVFGALFGLSPSDRAGVSAPTSESDKPGNRFAGL